MTNKFTLIPQIITLLHYQQLHLKYLCNLARYWLQAPWGWHDSVETCSSVIICEIIVYLLVIAQNNKRCTAHSIKIIEAQQTKIHNNYKNARLKLLKTNAAIWFNKTNCKLYYQQLHLKYRCNLAWYWLQAVWGWHDSVETCSSVIIRDIIVHFLVIVRNNKTTKKTKKLFYNVS
jgi:hypothetical protein